MRQMQQNNLVMMMMMQRMNGHSNTTTNTNMNTIITIPDQKIIRFKGVDLKPNYLVKKSDNFGESSDNPDGDNNVQLSTVKKAAFIKKPPCKPYMFDSEF